jgi:hypothetical protein
LANQFLTSSNRPQIRSSVSRSAGETTATLQPFFTLQLDIQSEGIRNVSDALMHNFTVEALDGYVCSRTKQVTRHEIKSVLPMARQKL